MLPRSEQRATDKGFDLLRTAFLEGGWMTLSNVIGPVMVVFDRFALTTFVALSVLSTYTIPQELALRAVLLPGALSATIFPRLAALDASGSTDNAVGQLVDRALRGVLALMLPVCIGGLLLADGVAAMIAFVLSIEHPDPTAVGIRTVRSPRECLDSSARPNSSSSSDFVSHFCTSSRVATC